MDYNKIFSPETISKLDKKSTDNLRQMLGDKTLTQTVMSSQKLLSDIAKAEAPYKSQLEKLAVDMVKELYPIIDEEGIVLDAKLTDISGVNSELNEIKINQPGSFESPYLVDSLDKWTKVLPYLKNKGYKWVSGDDLTERDYYDFGKNKYLKLSDEHPLSLVRGLHPEMLSGVSKAGIFESITPESRRRIINGITQGAALRGAFSFYLFKEHLDEIDPTLVDKYSDIMKNSFGIYDDPNAVAMMLSLLAQGHKAAGGSSKVIIKEIKVNNPFLTSDIVTAYVDNLLNKDGLINWDKYHQVFEELGFISGKKYWKGLGTSSGYIAFIKSLPYNKLTQLYNKLKELESKNLQESEQSGITIKARAICFPMLVHELIKGLYEITSLQGFKGDKSSNQAVVDKVDKLENEPNDIKYGKFVYDALNNVFASSEYSDPRIREFFFIDVYKLSDDDFISFIENAINETLTPGQLKWVDQTLKEISDDLKADDYDATGIGEIKINKPIAIDDEFIEKLSNNIETIKLNYERSKWEDRKDLVKSLKNHWNNKYKDISDEVLLDIIRDNANKLFEIKINKPKIFNFKSDPTYGIEAGVYILVNPEDEFGGYELQNVKTKQILNIDKHYAETNQVEKSIDEIKVNNPSIQSQLINFINGMIESNNPNIPKIATIFSKHGKGKGFNEWLVSASGPEMYKFFDEIKPFLNTKVDEIKVNNPSLKTPLPIDSIEKWNKIVPILKQKGYKWLGGREIELNHNFYHLPVFIYIDNKNNSYSVTNTNGNKNDFGGENGKFIYLSDEKKDIPSQLFEYSDKTIQTTIERWKKENPKVDDNLAKQIIQRFDQIKSGLAQKLQIVSLSDELKKGNNYLNIDKYSFEDMVKLIRSLPENPDKIKKDAINKFVDKEGIDRNLAQSYVARFMAKKDALKHGFNSGLEDIDMKAEDIKKLVPKHLHMNDAYLNPNSWKWEPFEQMLDALFPSQKQHGEVTNDVTTDADKVYSKNGLEIYKGDDVHKCISYNPANVTKGATKYGWCVTQPGNPNYDGYRFEERAPTFYFIFDRNKTSERNVSSFEDKWHAFVLQVNGDGKSYVVTAADNRGDEKVKSWEEISTIVPADTWAKIKDLKDIFKPIALSPVERGRKFASGKTLSLDEFKDLTQDEKIMYIQGKASKNALGDDILKILPKYKIEYEGRSTTLANIAIDSGQKFPYSSLKESEALAKRYAIFRFRHTNYSKDPIPLPYVKYLDDEAKEKYLKTFDDNLNFEYIEKFFGPKLAEEYVNKQIKTLDYLPPQAAKYIKDPKLKRLFEVYSKLFSSWKFGSDFNISDEELEKKSDMPTQDVTPIPINEKQWKDLTPQDRKVIIDLAGKVNKNDKYLTLLYALPFVIKDGDKSYVLVPKNNNDYSYNDWVIMDENGKELKNNISGESTLAGTTLTAGYPDSSDGFNRIYDLKDLKIK